MRTIGVVTGSRADYGIYQPLLRAIAADPALRLRLYVTGMHLSPAHGRTVAMIEQDGFAIAERIETLHGADAPEDIAQAIGRGVLGFAQAFGRARTDLLAPCRDRRIWVGPCALTAVNCEDLAWHGKWTKIKVWTSRWPHRWMSTFTRWSPTR